MHRSHFRADLVLAGLVVCAIGAALLGAAHRDTAPRRQPDLGTSDLECAGGNAADADLVLRTVQPRGGFLAQRHRSDHERGAAFAALSNADIAATPERAAVGAASRLCRVDHALFWQSARGPPV